MKPSDKISRYFSYAKLYAELRRDEGTRRTIYKDTAGIDTVGCGHNCLALPLPRAWTQPLTDDQISYLLVLDVERTIAALDYRAPWYADLDDVRQRAVVNMAFNLGVGGFLKFKKFIAALRRKDWDNAEAEMIDSDWSRQVGTRAVRLRKMILLGKA